MANGKATHVTGASAVLGMSTEAELIHNGVLVKQVVLLRGTVK